MKNLPTVIFCLIIFLIIKKKFFDNTDYKKMLKEGAVIVDVRSENEFLTGNIEGSLNIPLHDMLNNLEQLNDKEQQIITCCASGIRSATAKQLLRTKGYKKIVNGGGWNSLNNKIK